MAGNPIVPVEKRLLQVKLNFFGVIMQTKLIKPLLFNFLTKGYLRRSNGLFFLNRRLKAMAVDMSYVISVFFPFVLPFIVLGFFFDTGKLISSDWLSWNTLPVLPFPILTFALMNKDFFGARSVAKRIFGYRVLDLNTKEAASPLKCMLRNITIVVWPIEPVILLFSPRRRLGDLIAGTTIEDCNPDLPETILNDIAQPTGSDEVIRTVFLSAFIAIVFTYITQYLI